MGFKRVALCLENVKAYGSFMVCVKNGCWGILTHWQIISCNSNLVSDLQESYVLSETMQTASRHCLVKQVSMRLLILICALVCFRDNYEKMQAEIRLAKEELQQLEKARPSKVSVDGEKYCEQLVWNGAISIINQGHFLISTMYKKDYHDRWPFLLLFCVRLPPSNEQKTAQRLCCTFGGSAESYKVE